MYDEAWKFHKRFGPMFLAICLGFFIASLFSGCSSAPKGVIGVGYNQHGQVGYVFSGSPAARAGIQAGDYLFNAKKTKGAIGSFVDIKWIDVSNNNKLCKAKVQRIDINKLEGYNSTW